MNGIASILVIAFACRVLFSAFYDNYAETMLKRSVERDGLEAHKTKPAQAFRAAGYFAGLLRGHLEGGFVMLVVFLLTK